MPRLYQYILPQRHPLNRAKEHLQQVARLLGNFVIMLGICRGQDLFTRLTQAFRCEAR
jgi:hypothetical protein